LLAAEPSREVHSSALGFLWGQQGSCALST
jgi:hypothetical protein